MRVLLVMLVAGCASRDPGPGTGTTPTPATPPAVAPPHVHAVDPPLPPPRVEPDTPAGDAARRDAELASEAAGFFDAFVNSEAVFTRDGKRLVFVSNRDGLPQLYVADAAKPTSTATRLITTGDRVSGVQATPDGKGLVFLSDTNADENWKIFRVALDGTGLVDLTPGEAMQRDGAFLPRRGQEALFFSGRRHTEARSSLYRASSLRAAEPEVIHTEEMPAFLADVDETGTHALMVRIPSFGETSVVLVDVEAKQGRVVYPAEGKVTVNDAVFTRDGTRILVATDEGGERAAVVALDVKTGKQVARWADASLGTAQIGDLQVSPKGNFLAVSLVAGNRSELRVLDATSLGARATPRLPEGRGGAAEFSPDGARLLVVWSTPGSPTDVWSVMVKGGKATRAREEPRPSLAKRLPAIDVKTTMVEAHDGLKLPVHVYLPMDVVVRKQKPRLPVIVAYHGGPAGTAQIGWSPLAAFFVAQGYAWVEPNVRGSSGFGRAFEEGDNREGRRDALRDVETVARWAAAQPWADASKMIAFGGSYGGYTVLMTLARQPDLWRAGVDAFGVVDLAKFMATTSGTIHQVFLTEFGDPDKDAALFAELSPSTHVEQIEAPLFVYAGATDPRVPLGESDAIVRALRERGRTVEYMVAADEGHSLSRRATQLAFASRVARFLETHVK